MDCWGEKFVGDEEERWVAGNGVFVGLFTDLEGVKSKSFAIGYAGSVQDKEWCLC